MTPQQQLEFAAPFIQASLKRSPCGSTLQEVLSEVALGNARLWLGPQSAAVTQFVATEQIWHAGGDMADLIATMQRAWPIMQARGIERLAIQDTRNGWGKQLKPHGFKPTTMLIREAGNVEEEADDKAE